MHQPRGLRLGAVLSLALAGSVASAVGACSGRASPRSASATGGESGPADATSDTLPLRDAGTDTVALDSSSGADADDVTVVSESSVDAPSESPSDVDVPPDAPGLAALATCLGSSRALTISGQMPYLGVPVGGQSGEFVLDFASTFSSIDLAAFPTPPMTSSCDPSMLWQACTVPSFGFFGAPGTVTLTTEDFSGVSGSVRQAGIIGTDFLSEGVFTLAYERALAFDATQGAFCSDASLEGAGFAALSTAGFYANDLSRLEPFTQVDAKGPTGTTVPNVPTVPVQIAGVSAVAQLDTGFDDSVTPFSVNVNEAFLQAIVTAQPTALVRDATLDVTLTTCVSGVGEPIHGYRLAPGAALAFVDRAGKLARSYPQAVVFVKETPDAAQTCGGIGTWTVPAAQVAASYYVDMGVVAFDPYRETVWIPTN